MGPVRILIADDHDAIRLLIRNMLGSVEGWEVCGEAADGKQAVDQARLLQPDIVVMDLMMPGQNGFQATREILSFAPDTRILIATLYDFPALDFEAQAAGARGCFLKSEPGARLISAVRGLS